MREVAEERRRSCEVLGASAQAQAETTHSDLKFQSAGQFEKGRPLVVVPGERHTPAVILPVERPPSPMMEAKTAGPAAQSGGRVFPPVLTKSRNLSRQDGSAIQTFWPCARAAAAAADGVSGRAVSLAALEPRARASTRSLPTRRR